MRGGLGRTLLSAFLLLTIVPLAIISFLAVNWTRQELRQEAVDKLTAVARLKEAEIEAWIAALSGQLESLADNPASARVFLDLSAVRPASLETSVLAEQTLGVTRRAGALEEIGFFDLDGRLLVAVNPQRLTDFVPATDAMASVYVMDTLMGQPVVVLARAVRDEAGKAQGCIVGLVSLSVLNPLMTGRTDLGETGEAYLVGPDFELLTSLAGTSPAGLAEEALHTVGVEAALAGREGVALYTGYRGEPVIGVYRWLPSLQVALVVEQTQREAFARDDALAALLIVAALAVALLTTLLAAVITRRLSRPIVQLTLTAVKIAGGDLEQSVPVNRRDEIGILAQVFNVMTAELRTLYYGLEQKVAERTRQLREANQRLRYQAMQLAVSSEVGRTITSILDLDTLLEKIVELIRNSYRLLRVSIYLLDESGRRVVRQARIGWDGKRARQTELQTVHRDSLLGRAVAEGRPQLDDLRINLAIPLRAGQHIIGVLRLQAYQGDELSEGDVSALQSLADQVSVAIQNAQTYTVERGTVERLRRLDKIRSRSLSSMSRELATSLNSIIGFSRLILKGVDGPLTDQQRSDVSVINRSGQHLLGLLDDILQLLDLESGDHPLEPAPVQLAQLVAQVINQFVPLAEDKAVVLRSDCAANLPPLQADGERLHQVLTNLISSAVETTTSDAITIGARTMGQDDSEVMVCVASEAQIPWLDRNKDLEEALSNLTDKDLVWDGTESGIRLILSKRIIELHGGRLWVNNGPQKPAAMFVFTLPVAGVGSSSGNNGHGREKVRKVQ
jgi:signal transduction histidine kinase/HAMP domain-containing protein